MTITINGSGTITGISQGGLNDNIITQSELALTGVAGNGPAFSAYALNSQSIATGTWTKIVINTEEFDTNSNYDSTTNYRFTPTVAGYYQISGSAAVAPATSTGFSINSIYKNGSEFKRGTACSMNTFGNGNSVSALIYFNGSTDYVELYVIHNYGSSQPLNYGLIYAYFQAALVRAA